MNSQLEDRFLIDLNCNIGIVHRVCRIYFPYDSVEREDLLQEVMYQLWKSYPSFNNASKFSTWMYSVALNTAITRVKQKNRDPVKENLTLNSHQIAELLDTGQKERVSQLYAGIQTLNSVDRAIILLYLDENSYHEIATITGLTKTNVSVRLVRIKKDLEQKLKKKI